MSGKGKKPAAPRKKANGYKMPAPIASGEVIVDTIGKKKWRIGPSIGVGGFGEIYSACEENNSPKKGSNYPFVIKIEPHENGPLFVEKHFYVRNANKEDIANFMKSKNLSTFGMPTYYGNGSHMYKGEKYRYLVLERYGRDLWSIFKENGRSLPLTTVFQIGLQMLDVLEYIHGRGYVHADIKGANILLGLKKGTENQAYLVDFGLATRVNDKEFKPDPKCAHNGTIEYTSRDAHLGVSTMRGDLEILGLNLLQWAGGELPWEKHLDQPKVVHQMKESFLKDVRANITKQYPHVPDVLIKLFEYINSLKPKDVPDYDKCRAMFESYLRAHGAHRASRLQLSGGGGAVGGGERGPGGAAGGAKRKRGGRRPDPGDELEHDEREPRGERAVKKKGKRKSTEPALVVNVKIKKAKLTPKATPPVKRNHVSTATQTSGGAPARAPAPRRSPRGVTFDSPVAALIPSPDMFDDSFEDKKRARPKRRLLSEQEVTVRRVASTKVSQPTRSWRDLPTVLNGRAPPK